MNKKIDFNHLENDLEIYNDLTNVLNSEDIYDGTVISLYDVLVMTQKQLNEYELIKNKYQDYFSLLLNGFYDNPKVEIRDILGRNNELSIRIISNYQGKITSESITFSEKNYGLYIKNDETGFGNTIKSILSTEIANCYYDLLPYSDFYTEKKENIKPLNSDLLVNIDRFGICLTNEDEWSFDRFSFNAYSGFGFYQKGEYKCSNELSKSYSVIKGNEKELLKKIFVEIEECPEWSKETLHQVREKELNSIKRKVLKLFK